MKEFKILSPTAILGYGFPKKSFMEGMKRKPDVIAVDAGSTDPGPYYLGSGKSFTNRDAVKRDLNIIMENSIKNHIPLIIGTAGGSGGEIHLNWCKEIIYEIAKEKNLQFKLAIIHSQLPKEIIKKALKENKISPLGPVPPLTEEIIDETTAIVGQMGVEPFLKALDENVDIILAGRTYDPVVFAAPAIKAGYDKALSLHLGKILECAAICATPGSGSDCMFGYLGEDYFKLEPLNKERKCTTVSVAAHTLYEKSNPYILPGPGGYLDLKECEFIQEEENIVKVSGSKFVPSKYTIKLEGAKLIGYRTVSIAGARDPIMINKIDEIDESKNGVMFLWNDSNEIVRNEVDVVAVKDSVPIFISCKDSDKYNEMALNELNVYAEKFGGDNSYKILVATKDPIKSPVKIRAKEMGINIIIFDGNEEKFLKTIKSIIK